MRITIAKARQILNYDELAPTIVDKDKVSVTLPANLHQEIMKICRFEKRRRAEVIRQLCSAVIFSSGATIGRNDTIDRITQKIKPITNEQKKKVNIRKSMMSELKISLEKGGGLKKVDKNLLRRPKREGTGDVIT